MLKVCSLGASCSLKNISLLADTSAAGNFHFCCGTFCAGSRDTKLHRGGRKVQSRPSRCTASCRGLTSSCTPSLSGPRKVCVQVTKYLNPTSILFLMIRGLGWNLLFNCSTTLNVKHSERFSQFFQDICSSHQPKYRSSL